MTSSVGVTAVIPARAGSKGLPGKNLYPLLGSPLLQYTLEAAAESKVFDRMVVSSDSPEILDYARQIGAWDLDRPAELASDTASSDAVVKHLIDALHLAPDEILVLLQPTSPLRTEAHIREALAQFQAQMIPLISCHHVDNDCLKHYVYRNGRLTRLFPGSNHRRQDLPEVLAPNGALYIFSVAQFRSAGGIPREGVQPYLMSSWESIDIDTLEDIVEIETLMEKRSAHD